MTFRRCSSLMFGSKLTLIGRLGIAQVVITSAMLLSFAVLGWFGWVRYGVLGVKSAGVACGVCWIAGTIAMSSVMLFRDPRQAVQGLFLGMLFRLGLPLGVGLALTQSRSDLLRAGFLGMMIGVYQIGLFVETLLAWWIIESRTGATAPGMAAKAS